MSDGFDVTHRPATWIRDDERVPVVAGDINDIVYIYAEQPNEFNFLQEPFFCTPCWFSFPLRVRVERETRQLLLIDFIDKELGWCVCVVA